MLRTLRDGLNGPGCPQDFFIETVAIKTINYYEKYHVNSLKS